MFDEPGEPASEHALDPSARAREKSDEFRMHAELCAVFEGCRKFDATLLTNLGAADARDIQRTMGTLEKSRSPQHPVLPPESVQAALDLLRYPTTKSLSTNDYHIHRRPGEVMIVRWLAGSEVEAFYERFQAHFDVALSHFRDEEKQALGWKQDPAALEYLEALDKLEVKLADRYLRQPIRQHKLFVLSTQAADEIDILHLCDYVMGVEPAEVVGAGSAPPEEGATEAERAWFFKLFSLRGMDQQTERMCFFAFLQKSDDSGW